MVRPRIHKSGFANYTLDELRKTLKDLQYTSARIDEIVENTRKERALLKGKRLKQARAVALWRYLRTPLKQEMETTRSSLEYIIRKQLRADELDDIDTTRKDAYEAYMAVMKKLLNDFDLFIATNPGDTPLQVLRREQAEGKCKYVSQGEHWTDWVPEKVKDRVIELFDAVPYRKQAKTKAPFQRTVPKASARSRRRQLEEAMAKEYETLKATYDMYHIVEGMSPTRREEIETMQRGLEEKMDNLVQAQRILHRRRDNTALPQTWHGLLKLQGEG